MAAGLSIKKEKLKPFRRFFNSNITHTNETIISKNNEMLLLLRMNLLVAMN